MQCGVKDWSLLPVEESGHSSCSLEGADQEKQNKESCGV